MFDYCIIMKRQFLNIPSYICGGVICSIIDEAIFYDDNSLRSCQYSVFYMGKVYVSTHTTTHGHLKSEYLCDLGGITVKVVL